MTGWIKSYRSILQWEWYTDKNVHRAFTHLLHIANFKETRCKGHKIARGQVAISYPELARQTGLSVQEVRTVLDKLKTTGEISSVGCSKFMLITINNYAKYQGSNEDDILPEEEQNNGNTQFNTQLNIQPNTQTPSKSTRTPTRKKQSENSTNEPQTDIGGGDINTQDTTQNNTQPNTPVNTPPPTEITTSKEVKKIQEGKKGRNKEPKETHIDFIFKQGGGVSVDNSVDKEVVKAFEPLDENWWPSRHISRLCNEAGLIDEAIRSIRVRYITVCNREKFVYNNPDRGFVLFAKSYVAENLKDARLNPDEVASGVAKFMATVWPTKKGGGNV